MIYLKYNREQELARERANQYRKQKRDGFDVDQSGRTSDYILIVLIAVVVIGILYIESLVPLFERLIKSLIP